MKLIQFNEPKVVGKELEYIKEASKFFHISGDGIFSRKCNDFFKRKYNFKNNFLTTSCTDALEMIAIMLSFKNGEEILIPSYSFVSCANSFEIHGAKIKFCDVGIDFPNISYESIKKNITKKTKALLVIHYAGFSCEIDKIRNLCDQNNIVLIEDCAHAINQKINNIYLGSFGDFSVFSFHDTKNITCGEGGLLVVNNPKYVKTSYHVFHKGTNRYEFKNNLVSKYQWVQKGSSFLMSELNAAFLYGQLRKIDYIQMRRVNIINKYINNLAQIKNNNKFIIPDKFKSNHSSGHIFFLVCKDSKTRTCLINFLKTHLIHGTFHYLPLHKSKYYRLNYSDRPLLKNSDYFSNRIIRLPIHLNLKVNQVDYICDVISKFLSK